jgi:hypothetical protein
MERTVAKTFDRKASLLFTAAFFLVCCALVMVGWVSAAENRGPTLATTVTSSCYGWPEKEFSSTNKTGSLKTALAEGALAVDFTLKDLSGRSHTLSSLLATKPVLLVFGSFT